MKRVKKWLFPVLTCLIVAGAAVLPQRVSQARDAQQFRQVHTEELAADSLPAYEPPSLIDRLTLYANYYNFQHPVLSFDDPFYYENFSQEAADLMQSVQDRIIEADILPAWIFEEDPFTELDARRLLLWDPAEDSAVQEPVTFYIFQWTNYDKLHNKLLAMDVDAETGLPVRIDMFDTNISQWLPYEEEPLQAMVDRYFDLLGLEVEEVDGGLPPEAQTWRTRCYELTGAPIQYTVSRDPTSVRFTLEINRYKAGASSTTDGCDG